MPCSRSGKHSRTTPWQHALASLGKDGLRLARAVAPMIRTPALPSYKCGAIASSSLALAAVGSCCVCKPPPGRSHGKHCGRCNTVSATWHWPTHLVPFARNPPATSSPFRIDDPPLLVVLGGWCRHNLAFAVVPCCVFPSLFPQRRVPDCTGGGAEMVTTYNQFIDYLVLKATTAGRLCSVAFLKMQGKNRVLHSPAL